jgi:hypothetical protein
MRYFSQIIREKADIDNGGSILRLHSPSGRVETSALFLFFDSPGSARFYRIKPVFGVLSLKFQKEDPITTYGPGRSSLQEGVRTLFQPRLG